MFAQVLLYERIVVVAVAQQNPTVVIGQRKPFFQIIGKSANAYFQRFLRRIVIQLRHNDVVLMNRTSRNQGYHYQNDE